MEGALELNRQTNALILALLHASSMTLNELLKLLRLSSAAK